MSRHAHPAFPPAQASSGTQSLPPTPTSAPEIRDLILSCDTLRAIRGCLIPILLQVAEGKNQASIGTSPKEKVAMGEELLSMGNMDVYGMSDERVKEITAGLVFVMYAWHLDDR